MYGSFILRRLIAPFVSDRRLCVFEQRKQLGGHRLTRTLLCPKDSGNRISKLLHWPRPIGPSRLILKLVGTSETSDFCLSISADYDFAQRI